MATKPMEVLDKALDAISYDWLMSQHPQLAEAIEAEVNRGATPDQIKRAVMLRTQRVELALRCQQAARYLVGE